MFGFWHYLGFIALVAMFFLIPVWGRLVLWLAGRTLELAVKPLRRLRVAGPRADRRRGRCYALLALHAGELPQERAAHFRALVERGIRPRALARLLARELGSAHGLQADATTQLFGELARLRSSQQKLVGDSQVALERAWYQQRELDVITRRLERQ